jgi:hypothetical protein
VPAFHLGIDYAKWLFIVKDFGSFGVSLKGVGAGKFISEEGAMEKGWLLR